MSKVKMYDIVNLHNGVVYSVDKVELDHLLRKKIIYFHHHLNIFCYKKR